VYVVKDVSVDLDSQVELLVAMQPDQCNRQLLFLDAVDRRSLGFIELETQSAKSKIKIRQVDFTSRASTCSGDDSARNTTVADNATAANCDEDGVVPVTSALRGMLVAGNLESRVAVLPGVHRVAAERLLRHGGSEPGPGRGNRAAEPIRSRGPPARAVRPARNDGWRRMPA